MIMLFVVASIGSDGLLGTEALQSCLPHQLDLRMGQLWAEGRSTLQLHQQRLTHDVKGFLKTSVVLPPDSEIVAQFSVRSPSGVRLGSCSLVEPSMSLTEEYGVVVGHTLVDAPSWSASVLMVNPNAEEIVLPSFTMCGELSSSVGCFGGYGGRLVGCCCGSSSIGMSMYFQRRGNLLLVELRRFSMRK